MADIEKELGPLLDNYNKKFEEKMTKRQEQVKDDQDFKNVFNQLVEDVIRPEMNKYCQLLEKKGLRSILHESGHQVILSFTYKEAAFSEFITSILPYLELRIENRKISIYESKFDPSGLGCSAREGIYEINQITKSFIKEKLSSFLKSLFKRKGSLRL
jgi:hypothetical protein